MREDLWIGCVTVGELQTNCYILKNGEAGGEAVIVDPGGSPEKILKAIEKCRAVPEAILLTHGHHDHILAVNDIREAFPSVKVYISAKEEPMLKDPDLNCGFLENDRVTEADVLVSDGEELPLLERSFRVMETPGHTAGSVCYYSREDSLLISGDTIFRAGCGRCDLPTGDGKAMQETLYSLLTGLPDDTLILPGHGGSTTVSYERMIEGFDD